ncbi:hypothetical protein QTG54_016310 [Skeletonema marinoi]|uniref:Uncharacterized protein n=1 Tax=Skeletonema marinoi TaxID=267567 RepID=A0AAD8XSW9_9STRA|nr:hypothetical protein QTG54_016310 [Skeletonema marinoi]
MFFCLLSLNTRRVPTTHNAGGVFVSETPSFDEDEDGAKKIATAALNDPKASSLILSMTMVAAVASSTSPTSTTSSSRRSRQTIEEELWLLRSRSFVKSESLRLNSPRSRTSHNEECKRPARRWRRRIRRGDEDNNNNNNNNNFAEKMSNVARKARVFQLRVAGRRSWWPTMHNTSTAKIAAERDQQQQRHYEADLKLTSIDHFDKSKKKNSEGPKKEHESTPKKKFEWNALWKKKDRSNDQSETSVRRDFFLSSLSGRMTAEYRTGPDWMCAKRTSELGNQNSPEF